MGWTLADIEAKIRSVTGTPSTDQLTSAQVITYANNYYVFTMPFELKEQITNQFLKFKTVPGQDVYSFPGGYFTDSPGAYADGYPMVFYQDPDIFFQDWPLQYAVDDLATGDGITSTFTGTLQNPPLIISSLFISDGIQVLQSTSTLQNPLFPGIYTLTGDGTGTINYTTGAYSVTFSLPPASTTTIYGKYQGYSANRPQGVMFFNNEFTLRPVPDQTYQIQMQGFVKPTTLSSGTDTPLQEEWGPLIAYGASLEIFSDRGDMDNYDRYYPIFKRYENVALGRTIEQLNSQQSVPRF